MGAVKSQWQLTLQHRKRALVEANEEELDEYAKIVAADTQHARRRFFPVRASTWKRNRDVEMPSGLDADKVPIEAVLSPADDAVCDEVGLPNVANMNAGAESFQNWCKFGSWGACSRCHRLVKRRLLPVDSADLQHPKSRSAVVARGGSWGIQVSNPKISPTGCRIQSFAASRRRPRAA